MMSPQLIQKGCQKRTKMTTKHQKETTPFWIMMWRKTLRRTELSNFTGLSNNKSQCNDDSDLPFLIFLFPPQVSKKVADLILEKQPAYVKVSSYCRLVNIFSPATFIAAAEMSPPSLSSSLMASRCFILFLWHLFSTFIACRYWTTSCYEAVGVSLAVTASKITWNFSKSGKRKFNLIHRDKEKGGQYNLVFIQNVDHKIPSTIAWRYCDELKWTCVCVKWKLCRFSLLFYF